MNMKRYTLASIAVLLTSGILDSVIHGVFLKGLYEQSATVWRPMPEMMKLMWMYWLSYSIIAFIFTFMFAKGYEPQRSKIGQGIRFGLLFGFLMASTASLSSYATFPMPGILAFYWFFGMWLVYLVCGVVASLVYKPNA